MEGTQERGHTWVSYLWPGLPQLWWDGERSGLALALAAAVLLNLALATTLVWTELLSSSARLLVWTAVGAVWIGSSVLSARWWRQHRAGRPETVRHLFRQSLDQYLQGHWVEAEGLLARLLVAAPHDGDARLLLATLFRHTYRYDQARAQLERLRGCPGHEKWSWEIAQEFRQLEEVAAPGAQPGVTPTDTAPAMNQAEAEP
ncbi:MAG: hypothetical protein K1X74_18500 [Pirellulales bacterium]|nr:hypothetical protein [Pirellulales bacterium]